MLWDAEDALTRAKLLVAFGRRNSVWSERWPERRARFKEAYGEAARALGAAERELLLGFIDTTVPTNPGGKCPSCLSAHEEDGPYAEFVRKVIAD
jgi:hypothetical protein